MTYARFAYLPVALLMSFPALGRTFAIDSDGSKVQVHVGKTGLASFAGHEHDVAARSLNGTVIADREDLSRSSVDVTFEASSLKVISREPAEDVPKVQAEMQGPKVLDAARFPTIHFRSRSVTGSQLSPGVYNLKLTGEIFLRGRTKSITLPLSVQFSGVSLIARGKTTLKQIDSGSSRSPPGPGWSGGRRACRRIRDCRSRGAVRNSKPLDRHFLSRMGESLRATGGFPPLSCRRTLE